MSQGQFHMTYLAFGQRAFAVAAYESCGVVKLLPALFGDTLEIEALITDVSDWNWLAGLSRDELAAVRAERAACRECGYWFRLADLIDGACVECAKGHICEDCREYSASGLNELGYCARCAAEGVQCWCGETGLLKTRCPGCGGF